MTTMLRCRILIVTLTGLAGGVPAAHAGLFHLAVDVPANLGGNDVAPADVVASSDGVYVVEQTIGFPIGALARLPDGRWLVAPAEPALVAGGGLFYPRDLVAVDGAGTMSLYLDGAAAGIPPETAIDALAVDSDGIIALSFDIPTSVQGQEFGPSDIVVYLGGMFSPLFDGAGEGVPGYANLTGLDATSAGPLMTFDVPSSLAATESLPGDLMLWEGAGAWSLFLRDAAWPAAAHLRDFVLPAAAGTVPGGENATIPLTVEPAGGGRLLLSWSASCASGDIDYEIYEGVVGSFSDPLPIACSTFGLTSMVIAPAPGNTWYLVVPRNAAVEGSYGARSDGSERPASSSACLEQSLAPACD
ncbi:MAG TPA: hypothetical protein VMQ62_10045 [Dongiaceae bacterium]|nr:hypothetical protein [Dongiaceae bacterium]